MTDDVETTEHRGVRWYHAAVLGVAVLASAAAIGFSTSQSSDRDDATSARRTAQAKLASQRSDTTGAHTDLDTTRTETKATLAEVEKVTTSLHELSDLSAQEVDSLAAAHQLAIDSPDDVDGFNAQVDHATDLLTQMDAKSQEIQQFADEVRNRATAQFAVASSRELGT